MKLLLVIVCAVSGWAQTYRVQTPAGIVDIPAETYVAGVVTGESSVFRSEEALKAMAIAARTYAACLRGRHGDEGFDFCSTTHCQRYIPASFRATTAAQGTAGQFLWFNGKLAFSVYSRNCGGKTENVRAVWPEVAAPYLRSHADPYCSGAWHWSGTTETIRRVMVHAGLKVPAHLKSISVLKRTDSGRAQLLTLDGELLSASAFRFAVGRSIGWNAIRSELYSIESNGVEVRFQGSGEGHGVGLCQAGADQMGLSGSGYREILAFYYPGATLRAGDLNWTRLTGEGVSLYTRLPDSDRVLIGMAEGNREKWRGRLPWRFPGSIDIYAYPDLDAFRNATGEPGWVAGRTIGTRIELQPTAILREHHVVSSTLEHEMLHCFVESAANAGLPVWFREGMVGHLLHERAGVTKDVVDDTMLRQRQDGQTAAHGYAAARAQVDSLVSRYGETTVLSWVARGLPADVKNSTASKPAVNNK